MSPVTPVDVLVNLILGQTFQLLLNKTQRRVYLIDGQTVAVVVFSKMAGVLKYVALLTPLAKHRPS